MAVLRFPRGPDPTSIKLYQCSILLGDWKHEFCFGSGRAIFNGRIDDEDECRIMYGSVMDKQVIEVDDSIIIFGDVNPGSEIRSKGNIIVLGGLYGKASAGSYGDDSAFICAIEMEAEGLAIGEFGYAPETEPVWSAVLKSSPKVARVVNGEITIGPLSRVVMEKIYESKKLQAEGL